LSEKSIRPGLLCVHPSVFERRRTADPKSHENHQLALLKADKPCLKADTENENFAVRGRWRELPKVDGRCPDGTTQPLLVMQAPCEGEPK
jgi:hypothetical protein